MTHTIKKRVLYAYQGEKEILVVGDLVVHKNTPYHPSVVQGRLMTHEKGRIKSLERQINEHGNEEILAEMEIVEGEVEHWVGSTVIDNINNITRWGGRRDFDMFLDEFLPHFSGRINNSYWVDGGASA